MSEGAHFSARSRIRIFAPEPVFGYFLQEQKVTRPQAKPAAPRPQDAPLRFAGVTANSIQRMGSRKSRHRAPGDTPVAAPAERERRRLNKGVGRTSAAWQNKTMPVPSKGYTGDYPLCVLLVTFRTNEKSPQRSVRRTHRNHR